MIDIDWEVVGYRILVEPEVIDDKFEGSDFVKVDQTIDSDKRNTNTGTVLQVGPDAYKPGDCKGPWCEAGDFVLYIRGGGKEFLTEAGKELVIINEEDILLKKRGKR